MAHASKDNDTDGDEAMARLLQDQLLTEQEDSDAQLAQRLQEEERSKQVPSFMMPGMTRAPTSGRPQSATPIQNLFQALFHMRPMPLPLDDDDEDGTPAMEPGSSNTGIPEDLEATVTQAGGHTDTQGDNNTPTAPTATGRTTTGVTGRGGALGRRTGARGAPGTRRTTAAASSPERPRRTTHRSPERSVRGGGSRIPTRRTSSTTEAADPSPTAAGVPDTLDRLPGVRINPARRAPYQPFGNRGTFVLGRLPSEEESHIEEGITHPAVRPHGGRPMLGPREDTLNLPDGELDPDLMLLGDSPTGGGNREDNFVHMMRDPFLLMFLLMGRDPGLLIPDDTDIGDYESLWELAERLGEVRNRGMNADDINKLPTRVFRRKPGDSKANDDTCSVCLSEYKNGEKCSLLPCQHEYHQQCLLEWLKRNASCPICRQEVKKNS